MIARSHAFEVASMEAVRGHPKWSAVVGRQGDTQAICRHVMGFSI
jgi:hypothetical protein